MNKQKIITIFERFKANNPKPTTELIYHSSFELLLAVIMSAQMTDTGVNKVTAKLFKVANTPEQIVGLGIDQLQELMRSLNYYKTKASNIMKVCEQLIAQHQSQVPNTREELEELPGVGRKTANVILNTAFGQPTIAVDTHLFRVANRTNIAPGKDVRQVEEQLIKNIPKEYLHDAHHWLILHGRYVCKARTPLCKACIIQDLCEYDQKNL
jgi:endonuclease-3